MHTVPRYLLKSLFHPALALAVAAPLFAAGAAQTQQTQGAPKMEPKAVKQVAVMKTSAGTITFELLPNLAPKHVANFVELAKTGFYEGTKFHRVIPGFMVQGGDPNTKTTNVASWGTGNGPNRLPAEFSPAEKASHVRGMVSMARGGDPNSASCQFFIVQADSKYLDNQYSIFGQVLDGMSVVDTIANAPVADRQTNRPLNPVTIEKITIENR
jgi:peptidyl-prolyl cis-trans isomerase B (cyclophilin B)